jgi:hypothetical protein
MRRISEARVFDKRRCGAEELILDVHKHGSSAGRWNSTSLRYSEGLAGGCDYVGTRSRTSLDAAADFNEWFPLPAIPSVGVPCQRAYVMDNLLIFMDRTHGPSSRPLAGGAVHPRQ